MINITSLFILTTTLFLSTIIFFLLRCFPLWNTKNQGCDAFYFLLCAEQFRKKPRLPIILQPHFILENSEQWYPPIFSIFLSLFPEKWLDRNHWVINQFIDFVLIVFAFFIVVNLYSIPLALGIILAYAMQTSLIMEFRGLSSRPLGLLFTTLFIFSSYYDSINPSFMTIIPCILLGVLIIYTHKLSSQLLWFLMPFLSIFYLDPIWILFLLLSYLFAFLIWPSLFIKIIHAHYDIMRFWAKNWPILGAHPIKQSPIYGNNEVKIQYFKENGIKGLFNIFRTLGHLNYWVIFIPLAILEYSNILFFERFLLITVIGIYIWAMITWIFPKLRFLGLGQQYIKYAYVPNLILAAGMIATLNKPSYIALAFICLVLTVRQYVMVTKEMRRADITQTGYLSQDLLQMIGHIKALKNPRLMCLPFHYADLIAYSARTPVLWGAHGYGFKNLQDVFPVILKPLKEVANQYSLTHLLIKKGYCEIDTLGFEKNSVEYETNDFILLSFI